MNHVVTKFFGIALGFLCLNQSLYAVCAGGVAVGGPLNKPGQTIAPTGLPATSAVSPNVSAGAAPPPIVGKVVWTQGPLKVMGADGKIRTLKKDDVIRLHDTVITNAAQAEVVFSDHSIVTFQKNTKFYVNKYEYHPEVKQGSVGTYIMDLIEGGYRTVTGAIAKTRSQDYQINTEVGIMGVRGTDYGANFKGCQLYMKRYTGKPLVHNAGGSILLTPGQPYAMVNSATTPPVFVAKEPVVFKTTLPIVPAVFSLSPSSTRMEGGGNLGNKFCIGG